jgi:hypothetical protein
MWKRWMMLSAAAGMVAGCAGSEDTGVPAPETLEIAPGDYTKGQGGPGDASVEAIFVDFSFDGELVTGSTWNPQRQIEDQMLYTVGQLNGDNSVGRLDRLRLTDITTEREGSQTRVSYHAELVVAWGNRDDVPAEYELVLPRDISYQGQRDFTEDYKDSCVDWSAHDVDSGSMWYYYRPDAWNCELADEDVVRLQADVSVSDVNTTGKYPEYHKIYEDDVLNVVAVFGKYEDGATSTSDAGIRAYNTFVGEMNDHLSSLDPTVTPPNPGDSPGVEHPDITWEADLGDGKSLSVTTLLVDNVRTAGVDFDRRYEALSGDADLIVYSGHAGLGANIRALARKGRWQQGQYAVVFMNGCDTYAYVDSALNDAHAAVNPDDPTGTKYLDIVTNAMPAYFREVAGDTMAMVRGLMKYDDPQTFEQMFRGVDDSQVVLVSGEQDNVYVPGYGEAGEVDRDWSSFTESGRVAQGEEHHYATPKVPAGEYVVELSGTADADLYVKVGGEPTTDDWDCRPYRAGSDEECAVELNSAASIHVMVRGWASDSEYEVTARKLSESGGDEPAPRVYTNDASVDIPDNDASGATSVIAIADSGRIDTLRVDLAVRHTYRGDLRVKLTHDGTTVTLFNGATASSGWEDDVVLDGELVEAFDGRELSGEWALQVVDTAARDTGAIESWSLIATTQP